MSERVRGNEIGAVGLHVAARVRELRAARGETLETVAARMTDAGQRITYSGMHKIETGARRVEVDDLIALADALGVDPVDLLPGRNPSDASQFAVKVLRQALLLLDGSAS